MTIARTIVPARCLLIAAGLVVAGLASGRPAAVALAAPFAIGPALAYLRRVPAAPTVLLEATLEEVFEGDVVEVAVTIMARSDLDVILCELHTEGFAPVGTELIWTIALRAGQQYVTGVPLRAEHWGRNRIGPLVVSARSAGLLEALDDVVSPPIAVPVYPQVGRIRSSTAAPYALAYAGEHRSRAIGPGVELAAVRPLVAGDRMRQINWRATLRTGEMHVTTSTTECSTSVLLMIDTQHDVGSVGSSTLDASVRAALAVAQHYLSLGDAVALADRSGLGRNLATGTGPKQLARVREWLLDLRSAPSSAPAVAPYAARPPAARGFVIAFSPLLDEATVLELATARRRGSPVFVVDVLTVDVLPRPTDETGDAARRLWLLERRAYLDRLGDLGVPIIQWTEGLDLHTALSDMARFAAAARRQVR